MITNLKSNGFRNDEICLITGYKNERSINRYDRLANERTIKRLSNSLSIGKIERNVDILDQKIKRTDKDCYVNIVLFKIAHFGNNLCMTLASLLKLY